MIKKLVGSAYFDKPVSIQSAILAECEQESGGGREYDLLFEAGRYISTLECMAHMLVKLVLESGMSCDEIADHLEEFFADNKTFHERTMTDAELMIWEEFA